MLVELAVRAGRGAEEPYIACVTLGAGAPLLPRRLELRLEEVQPNGDFAAARYSVVGGLTTSD